MSLLQVEGIGRNIVPVFYAVTRPASINFLVFLAIVVWLVVNLGVGQHGQHTLR